MPKLLVFVFRLLIIFAALFLVTFAATAHTFVAAIMALGCAATLLTLMTPSPEDF